MTEFRQSLKQTEIMGLVVTANADGVPISLPQLQAKLSYGASVKRQAILCSIKILERHGMLTRENSKSKSMRLIPTDLAAMYFKPVSSGI